MGRLLHYLLAAIITVNVEIKPTGSQSCTRPPVAAFSAVRQTTMLARDKVPFDIVVVDTVKGFDSAKTVHTVKSSGFYMFQMSAGVPISQNLRYYMRGGSSTPGLLVSHQEFDGEFVTSRHDIQYVNENQQLYLSTKHDLQSDGFVQTSWCGFKIDDVMNRTVLFSVARTTNYTAAPSSTVPIVFDKPFSNLGQGWDSCNTTNRFIAPVDGIYFLSWSTATMPNTMHEVRLLINGKFRGRTVMQAASLPGVDTTSMMIMEYMNASDVAQLFLWPGSGSPSLYSDSNYQTAFVGFLYEPLHDKRVAWTVTFPEFANVSFEGSETYTRVKFTEVRVNEGGAWDAANYTIVIPVSGLYYVYLSGVAWPRNELFNMIIALNENDLDAINAVDKVSDKVRTTLYTVRGRGLIVHLNKGDTLIAAVPNNFQVYCNQYETTFSGFLIQPDDVTSSTTADATPPRVPESVEPYNKQASCDLTVTAFAAARKSPLPYASGAVPYPERILDAKQAFNDSTNAFYVIKTPGFYFIHFSAGVPGYQFVNYTLRDASSTPNIILTHKTFDGELVMSRDDVQYLGEGQTIHMSSEFPLYSDSLMQTTWSGFRLDDIMSPLIIFRAAKTSPQTSVNGTLTLDRLTVSVGGTWDSCTNRFIVPRDGIYFISWSSASVAGTTHYTRLRINGENRAEAGIIGGPFNGNDVTSQSVLLKLNKSDEVTLHLPETFQVFSDSNYQTSLFGFLYEPINIAQKVAWSVSSDKNETFGPANVEFNRVFLNEGGGWNAGQGSFTVPVTGTYFLKLSAAAFPMPYKLNVALMLNGQPLFSIIEKITVRVTSYNVRTNALLYPLNAGDVITISVPQGYNCYSDEFEMIFAGFLLF